MSFVRSLFVSVFLFLVVASVGQSTHKEHSNTATPEKQLPTSVVLKRIRSATVQIEFDVEYAYVSQPANRITKSGSLGSGLVIDAAHHVVTARHVVEEFQSLRDRILNAPVGPEGRIDPQSVKALLKVGFAEEELVVPGSEALTFGNFVSVPASVLSESPTHDVAVLSVAGVPQRPLVKIGGAMLGILQPEVPIVDKEFGAEWEPIGAAGYPLTIPSLVTTFGRIGARYALDDRGRVVQLGSIQVNPGNSGGPIFRLRDGDVIGIATAYWNASTPVQVALAPNQVVQGTVETNSGLAVITPIRYAWNCCADKALNHSSIFRFLS